MRQLELPRAYLRQLWLELELTCKTARANWIPMLQVTYSVNGDGGYVADVTYEGEAVYPEVKPYAPPAPAYKPAAY